MNSIAVESKPAFSVSVDVLLAAATKVGYVIPATSPKPVLCNMLIRAEGNALELVGTDLGTIVRHTIADVDVTSEGVGLVEADRFLQLLKQFRGNDAKIAFGDKSECRFRSKGGSYKLYGECPDDYPTLKSFDGLDGLNIKGTDFLDMISRSEFAVAENQNRQAMHAVCFELRDDGCFRMAATDSSRIALVQKFSVDRPDSLEFKAIVPGVNLKAFAKVIGKSANVVVGTKGSYLFARTDCASVASVLADGSFPDYDAALAVELDKQIDVDTEEFRTAIQRAKLVDDNIAAFHFENDELLIKSKSADVGSGEVTFPISYSGEPVTIGFNPSFIDDGLSVMKAEKCRFHFEDAYKAGILKELAAVGNESDRFVYAFMPYTLED